MNMHQVISDTQQSIYVTVFMFIIYRIIQLYIPPLGRFRYFCALKSGLANKINVLK